MMLKTVGEEDNSSSQLEDGAVRARTLFLVWHWWIAWVWMDPCMDSPDFFLNLKRYSKTRANIKNHHPLTLVGQSLGLPEWCNMTGVFEECIKSEVSLFLPFVWWIIFFQPHKTPALALLLYRWCLFQQMVFRAVSTLSLTFKRHL